MTNRKKEIKTAWKRYTQEFKDETLAMTIGVPAAARELVLHEFESPRLSRRVFGLSQATMADPLVWS